MIPNATSVAEVESTFAGEDVEMEFDLNSLAHLMGVLSDIYSNPTMAVVREYTVNAIDSHVDAGNPEPVQVSLPNAFSPNLIIQDFGLGMSAEDIRTVYSKYGASTKRLSDTVSGMLGIGAKSAFAYSNGFLVTGIKDGVKTHVSVNRSEEGGGVMTILAESKTDESNGVTISIPVRDMYEMKQAVTQFCSYLEPGKVLVDGQDLSLRHEWELIAFDVKDDDGKVIIHNLWRAPGGASKVIMGNVPYDPTVPIALSYTHPVYAEVVMGAVAFEPSRESLKDSALTRTTQSLITETYRDILSKQISQEIATAPNKAAAFKAMKGLLPKMNEIGVTSLEYKGETVPSLSQIAIDVPQDKKSITNASIGSNTGYFNPRREFSYDALDKVQLIVTDAPEHNRPGPVFRQRIVNYADRVLGISSPWGYLNVLLLHAGQESYLENDWLDTSAITVPWSVLKTEYVDRTRIGGGGIKTAGKHFVVGEYGTSSLQEVDDEDAIVYFTGSEVRKDWDIKKFTGLDRPRAFSPYDKHALDSFMAIVRKVVDKDTVIVDVYANRKEKFLRDYPHARPLTWTDLYDKMVEHYRTAVSDADFLASLRLGGVDHLGLLPDDDDDVAYLRSVGEGGDARKAKLAKIAIAIGDEEINKRYNAVKDECTRRGQVVRNRYPLLGAFSGYVNSRYHEIIRKHLMIEFLESQEDNDDSV